MTSTSRISNYIRQFEELYSGGNFLDENFSDKVSTINDAVAFAAPEIGAHSVAEIVWHCIYWRNVNMHRLQGDNNYRDETVDELNWVPIENLKKKGWKKLTKEFDESQSQWIKLLNKSDDSFLQNEYERGKDFAYLIDGTIQHDAYHLGQIGFVLKLLKLKGVKI